MKKPMRKRSGRSAGLSSISFQAVLHDPERVIVDHWEIQHAPFRLGSVGNHAKSSHSAEYSYERAEKAVLDALVSSGKAHMEGDDIVIPSLGGVLDDASHILIAVERVERRSGLKTWYDVRAKITVPAAAVYRG